LLKRNDDKKRKNNLIEDHLEINQTKMKINKLLDNQKKNSPKNLNNKATINHANQFMAIFIESKIISQTEFTMRCLDNHSASFLLKQMETIIESLVDDMDNKLKTPLYRKPLNKIIELEGKSVPIAITLLCKKISEKIEENKQSDKMLKILNYRENIFCNLIIKIYKKGKFSACLDFEDNSFSVLLFALQRILKSLKYPLFTKFVSGLIVSQLDQYHQYKNIFDNAFFLVPRSHLETILLVNNTLNKVMNHLKNIFTEVDVASLFLPCFFSFDQINHTNMLSAFYYFTSNYNTHLRESNQFC
jgi:hypothetical protein